MVFFKKIKLVILKYFTFEKSGMSIKLRPGKRVYLWKNTNTNMKSLTIFRWFTSAFLLRRSSTIRSWPFQLAIYSAVWPFCTCIVEQKWWKPTNFTEIWMNLGDPNICLEAHLLVGSVCLSVVTGFHVYSIKCNKPDVFEICEAD